MRCNLKCKELPKTCPKCGSRLKKEKCKCGHTVCQEKTNTEKRWERGLFYGGQTLCMWDW